MQREHVVMVCYADIANQTRGKGFPASERALRLRTGVGWTPTNIQLTAFGPIADTPFGPFGDLVLMPDPATEVHLAFGEDHPVEHFFLADVQNTDGTPWECCPRTFLKSALDDLEREFGLRLTAAFEHEFYHFDGTARPASAYHLDALRRHGLFAEVFLGALRAAGLEPESYLAEYGPRQYEVTVRAAPGLVAADRAVMLKEIARSAAAALGQRVSFAPAVTPEVVGNGVHIHLSLQDLEGRPVMYEPAAPFGLGQTGGRFAAGILRHARALTALSAPAVVSYVRLVPHRWSAAWTSLGHRDREACLRICPVRDAAGIWPGDQYHLEFRAADACANPYLALGAIVRAGLEGLRGGLPAPDATPVDPGALEEEERLRRDIHPLPHSLDEALDALLEDEVAKAWFPESLLDVYHRHKRAEVTIMADLDREERCGRYADAY